MTDSARKALVVANPLSRYGSRDATTAIGELRRAGLVCEEVMAPSAASAAREVMERIDGADLVIAIGGDGTLNSVADAVRRSGLPLGIIPSGTANDLARTLAIPENIAEAADVIARGRTRAIDLGEVNGHPFFNVASMGLSAELADNLGRGLKRRWGRLGYAVAALRALIQARPFHAAIVADGGLPIAVRTLQIAVGNGRHYGGGMVVEADAAIDDGWLDLYSLEFDRLWKLFLLFGLFQSGRHGVLHDVRTMRGTEFEIRTRRPRPINTDGELVTFTPALFRVLPGAVRVFVP